MFVMLGAESGKGVKIHHSKLMIVLKKSRRRNCPIQGIGTSNEPDINPKSLHTLSASSLRVLLADRFGSRILPPVRVLPAP